jgi:hypothetical protein
MKHIATISLMLGLGLAAVCGAGAAPAQLYVAPTGNDAAPGSLDKPLASFAGARDRVRVLLERSTPPKNIVVQFEPGLYRMTEPVVFDARDSGRGGRGIVYRCRTPGAARFVGGRRLTGWTRHAGSIWKVRIEPQLTFHTLYEGGTRVRKARLPNYTFDPNHASAAAPYFTSERGSPELKAGQTNAWIVCRQKDVNLATVDARQLRINVWPWGKCDWHRYIFRVVAIDPQTRTLTFDPLGDRTKIDARARYFLEDSMNFLDAPGEFFLDRAKDTLFYIPLGDGHPDELDVVAPVTLDIIRIAGESRDNPVRNLVFDGLGFEVTDGLSPQLHWWSRFWKGTNHALVHLSGAERIEFRNCHFKNSGCSGIFMARHNVSNIVTGCWIEQMGINGITLCNWAAADSQGGKPNQDRLENNILTNNKIHDVGQLAVYAAGVNLMCGSHNQISHSEFFNSPRYAITMRGNVAGQHGPERLNPAIPPASGNVFEYLDTHDLGHDSGDMGALHTATLNLRGGAAVNTFRQITVKRVHAVPGMHDYPPDGIFLDWPSRSMHQRFENVWIRNVGGRQIRSNGPDNERSAVTHNVSWKPGFDTSLMETNRIGLLPSFPREYGGQGVTTGPGQVNVRISEVTDSTVKLAWNPVAPGARYEVWRDGARLAELRQAAFEDNGLQEQARHVYAIRARTSPADELGPPARVEAQTLADGTPPQTVGNAFRLDRATILVRFNEALDEQTALEVGRYRLRPAGVVQLARRTSDGHGVLLTVSNAAGRDPLHVVVSGMRDASSARNAMSAPLTVPVDSRALLAHYTFDDTTDGTASDSGPGGFHGTLQAGATIEKPADTNGALRLDGNGSHVRCPAAVDFKTTEFTVAAWIRKADTASRIVLAKGNGYVRNEWSLGWVWPTSVSNISFRADNRFVASQPGGVPADRWVHVAFVRGGDMGYIYIDGKLSNQTPGLGNAPCGNAKPLLIGRRELDESPAPFKGWIDDVRLYRYMLTPEEIGVLAHYKRPPHFP